MPWNAAMSVGAARQADLWDWHKPCVPKYLPAALLRCHVRRPRRSALYRPDFPPPASGPVHVLGFRPPVGCLPHMHNAEMSA